MSIALNTAGTRLYIADLDFNRVREVDLSTGIITAFAGTGTFGLPYIGDGGDARFATMAAPMGVATDTFGNVHITDIVSCVIRRVDASGIISTFAGNGNCRIPGAGDGGLATHAALNFPARVATDGAGNVFIADSGDKSVRRAPRTLRATSTSRASRRFSP